MKKIKLDDIEIDCLMVIPFNQVALAMNYIKRLKYDVIRWIQYDYVSEWGCGKVQFLSQMPVSVHSNIKQFDMFV